MAAERSVVMIVDDDHSIRQATHRLIKSFELAVETFGSADGFLSSGRIAVTACLVLDVHLPGLRAYPGRAWRQEMIPQAR